VGVGWEDEGRIDALVGDGRRGRVLRRRMRRVSVGAGVSVGGIMAVGRRGRRGVELLACCLSRVRFGSWSKINRASVC